LRKTKSVRTGKAEMKRNDEIGDLVADFGGIWKPAWQNELPG
jgi:hypothetical protein